VIIVSNKTAQNKEGNTNASQFQTG